MHRTLLEQLVVFEARPVLPGCLPSKYTFPTHHLPVRFFLSSLTALQQSAARSQNDSLSLIVGHSFLYTPAFFADTRNPDSARISWYDHRVILRSCIDKTSREENYWIMNKITYTFRWKLPIWIYIKKWFDDNIYPSFRQLSMMKLIYKYWLLWGVLVW